MYINLSDETMETIYNSLRCTKQSLKKQLEQNVKSNKREIIIYQLEKVDDALFVWEEFLNS